MTATMPAQEAGLPKVINERESEVRSYCRTWPTTFASASGSWLTDTSGERYLDFTVPAHSTTGTTIRY